MRPDLRARASANAGVFTRRDAADCGYTERELKTLTGHRGAWVVVRRGCYAERALWESLDDDGRYLFKVRAVSLSLTRHAVVSHGSAAVVLGMPLRPRWRELAHVTRPGVRGSRTESGVKHHLGSFDDTDLVVVEGLQVTRPARTALDVAREHGFEDGVVAADAALRLGATRQELAASLEGMGCWPRVTAARAAVEVADGGAQTIGESLLRLMVLELQIGVPESQFVIVEGGKRAEIDLRVGRHLFEFDGHIKYVGRDRGGVADESPEVVLWREKQREDWVRRANGGYGMSRVIWREMFGPTRRATLRRLHEEFAATLRRFGDAMWT
ncbi:MAG TPA: type IV toxin-antitoxin system AbiEi family antitoxin domain-containing protein [Nocardioidaceae bacterium]|nr:type IV toxin-antitoxin system AbiEi family antitoxin domain-containing protein [Nocardioidaceae bacterium]